MKSAADETVLRTGLFTSFGNKFRGQTPLAWAFESVPVPAALSCGTFRLPVHIINLGVNRLFLHKLLTFYLGLGMFLPAIQAAPALHIACWGDSLTFGTGTPPGLPFPTVLQGLLPGSDVFNGGIAGEKSYEIAARFFADQSRWGDFTVIWVGRNNYSETTQILGDVADMVAALPSPKKFVVLSVLTGDFPTEYAGQSGYNLIHSVNETLRVDLSGELPRYSEFSRVAVQSSQPTRYHGSLTRNTAVVPSNRRCTSLSQRVRPGRRKSSAIYSRRKGFAVRQRREA